MAAPTLDEIAVRTMDDILAAVSSSAAAVFILDDMDGRLRLQAQQGRNAATFVDLPSRVASPLAQPRVLFDPARGDGFLAVPLRARNRFCGVAAVAVGGEPKLTLLRVVSLIPAGLTGQDVIEKIRREQLHAARAYLEAAAKEATKAGVTANAVTLPGDPARTIINFAREKGADTIIMNSHGAGGLTGYVFGSVAEKVLRGAECPVMVLHERPTADELWAQEEREEAEFDAMMGASRSALAQKG
ncbi:MAG: universal stress protein [Dehalococcoidia bacterium]|nr:universal stress protein [Dehalococcoidia bacterium]